MFINLVQGKRRSFFDLADKEMQVQYTGAGLLTLIMGFYAQKAHLLAPRIGFGLAAVFFFVVAVSAWRNRKSATPTHERDGRTYCHELVELYEQRIRSVRRAHWYAFIFAVEMAALTVWPYTGTIGSVILCGLLVLVWLRMRRDGIAKVEELGLRKQEVVELLKEMDRA